MKKKNYLFVLTTVLIFAAINVYSATYYVDALHPNASDDNVGTDSSAPWKTLNTSKWKETGGVINLSAGNYYLTVETYIEANTELIGTSRDEVVILSMDDDDFAEDRFGNAPLTERFFTAASDVKLTVKNLTMKNLRFGNDEGNPDTGGMLNTNENAVLLVENVKFQNAIVPKGANAVVNAMGPVTLRDVVIEDCELEETGDSNDAIVCVGSNGTSMLSMDKVRIFNCFSSGGSIVNVKQGGNGNSELYVNNCTFENNTYANWGGGIRGVCREPGKINFHITNSFFMHNQGGGTGCTFIQSDGDPAEKELNVLFVNNTFIENYKDGGHNSVYSSNDDGQAWITGSFTFVNNTMVNNSSSEPGKNGNGFLFVQTPNAEFNFINNIAMTNEGESMVLFNLPEHRDDYDKPGLGTTTGNITERVGGGLNFVVLSVIDEEKGNYLAPEKTDDEGRIPLSELILFNDVVRPDNGNAPFLPVLEGAFNIDKGKLHDLVPDLDSRGAEIYGDFKDVGAFEYNPDFTDDTSVKPLKDDDNRMFVYPNPFNDCIYVSEEIESVEIFNLNGSLILSKNIRSQINVSELKKGLYLMRLKNREGKTTVFKVLK